jgi:para-nitrobenzyl esterase
MSAADSWSRRAVLGGVLATAAVAEGVARAQWINPSNSVAPIDAPDGRYAADELQPLTADGQILARAFTGIRYARAERFQPPEPNFRAEKLPRLGPASPQPGDRYPHQSEDCHFLNIWAPATARRPLPVMVYFHGGAYSTGSVTDPLNDGTALAARGNVVVVTVNHRLNIFGYLYQPDRFPDSGNNGQLDLVCALQWVQRNIGAFGGDARNITVFGQSGGGAKIATLMAMPAAQRLFHKAITMSGQQVTASGPLNAARRARAFLAALGDRADPATAPTEQLIAALSAADPILGGGIYMGPVLDMRNLHRHPFWPDAPPQSAHIPMLLGNTVMEARAFYPLNGRVLSGLDWPNLAERIAPEMRIDAHPGWVVSQFRSQYPDAAPLELFHRIVTAARSWRGQVEEVEARAAGGRRNTYVYRLDFRQAQHTDDIALAFGNTEPGDAGQRSMSERVMDAFVRFARTGDPGWQAYDKRGRQTMIFDTHSRVERDPRRWERELFARIPYVQPGT